MGIVEYNYAEFTGKDMFQVRLAATIPDFGYISIKHRRPFYEFCKKNEFLSLYSQTSDRKTGVYNVHTTFRFSAMFNYRVMPVIVASGVSMILVGQDFKMLNTGPQK